MNTRRSTGIIKTNKRSISRLYMTSLNTKTITPELHTINAKICRLVEQYPCMYDRSHAAYMRKSHVEQAWVEISREMNDTVENCKERFRNIRTSFARSINVQRGSNRVKPYYLSEELEFLKKHITPGVPVPAKGRRSRDSSNRRCDDNDEYDENDNEDEEYAGALVHIKHSLSSDEHENENSTDSSEWVADEHAQSIASQMLDKLESKFPSQSDDDEQKPKNLLQPNAIQQNCPFPPKKRCRPVADVLKPTEPVIVGVDPEDSNADIKPLMVDFDDAFLQGLRPEMNHMDFHQKLYFKRRVYELLGEIFESNENGVSSQPRTNGQPVANCSPTTLQHFGLLGRTGTLQLPKLQSKSTKEF